MMFRSRFPVIAIGLAAGALAVLLIGGLVMTLAVNTPQTAAVGAVRTSGTAAIGGPFELVDHTGAPFTEADLTGKPSLIYFGYTFCPDVCPLSLQQMAAAIDRLPEDEQSAVRPVFVSVDPERDTVERLAEYVASPSFPDGLIGLTGTTEQVDAAKQTYRIHSEKGAQEGDFYLVNHTSLIYLMDADGTFVAAFGHTESPETIAMTLSAIL